MSLAVTITPCGLNGLLLTLTADEQVCSIAASSIPYASLSELTASLIATLCATGKSRSRWNTEPVEYEIVLESSDERGTVEVWSYPDTGRQHDKSQLVFSDTGELRSIARTFWRALRRLESDTSFVSQWQYSFPRRDVDRLGQLLSPRTAL